MVASGGACRQIFQPPGTIGAHVPPLQSALLAQSPLPPAPLPVLVVVVTPGPEVTAMPAGNLTRDAEAEARAAALHAIGRAAEKGRENVRRVLGGDPGALIAHGEPHAPAGAALGGHGDLAAFGAVRDRVVDQVAQHA